MRSAAVLRIKQKKEAFTFNVLIVGGNATEFYGHLGLSKPAYNLADVNVYFNLSIDDGIERPPSQQSRKDQKVYHAVLCCDEDIQEVLKYQIQYRSHAELFVQVTATRRLSYVGSLNVAQGYAVATEVDVQWITTALVHPHWNLQTVFHNLDAKEESIPIFRGIWESYAVQLALMKKTAVVLSETEMSRIITMPVANMIYEYLFFGDKATRRVAAKIQELDAHNKPVVDDNDNGGCCGFLKRNGK